MKAKRLTETPGGIQRGFGMVLPAGNCGTRAFLTVLATGLFLAGGLSPALATDAADDTNAIAPVAAPAQPTNTPTTVADNSDDSTDATEYSSGKGLVFKFRGVSLDVVLNYMSKAAGFIIHPQVSINGTVDAYSDQPLSKDEALALVEHILSDNGYAVVRDQRILTIISAEQAKRSQIPVVKFTSLNDIPNNSEVATYIIPVRTLNPVALLNNLRPLIGSDTDLQANESANSIMITDSQNNIKRIANIIMQLDSVSASINTIEVFPLKYADAKAISDTIKELFPSQAGAGSTQGGGNAPRFGNGNGFPGGGFQGGGFPGMGQATGGGNGNGNGGGSGTTPTSRIAATADDHSNSLIVSAPEDLIPTIRELVGKLDQPVEDITEVRMFHLKHADPTELTTLLGNLFPDADSSTDASRSPFQFNGPGQFGPGAQASTTASTASDHLKKVANVIAVPDPRTQSLVVSASKTMMPQIEEMIARLDEIDSGIMHVHRIALQNAEPQDVLQILQSIYPASSTSSSSSTSTQSNPLLSRAQTMQQNMLSTGVGSGSATASTSTSGSSRSGL